MNGLPKGWIRISLGELGEWRGGGTPSKSKPAFWDGNIPWVSPKDMKRAHIDDAHDKITLDAIDESATSLIPKGGVLVVTRSGILRHSLPVAVNTREVAINQDLKALSPEPFVTPDFIALQLRSSAQAILAACAKSGTTVDSLDFDRFKAFPFSLAPLGEQQRIVEKLDYLAARTARARADLDRIPGLAARNKQAVLEKAFAGQLFTDGLDGWKKLTLGELGKWGSGGTPKSGRAEYYGGAIPWVRSGDLSDGPVASHVVTITNAGLANSSAKWVPEGTVLLAMYGATIGKVGFTTYPVTTNQAVASLQCDQSLISTSFAFWLLRSLKPAFVGAGQGGAQPNISQTIIKSWPTLVPPLAKQEKIVQGLERAFAEIDRLTAEAAAARSLLGRLDQALLAKAFRGELVPQDPGDEPASILLDQTLADRAGSPKARRKLSSRPPAARKKSDMPKSRLDDDVKHQPFLASILKASGTALSADSLFESADLPITDFYKQLAWEIDNGLVAERGGSLEAV